MASGFGAVAVESPQRQMSVLALRKIGAGTPVLSGLCAPFCTVTDNGVGDYTILVNVQRPFSQPVIGVATPHSAGIITVVVAETDALQITVNCFAVDGTTPAELNFDLVLFGSFARDLIGI